MAEKYTATEWATMEGGHTVETLTEDSFSFIKDNCNESKMFRNTHLNSLTLRDAVDAAFLNMITLYMLSCEFETAPFAQEYAKKTIKLLDKKIKFISKRKEASALNKVSFVAVEEMSHIHI